MKLEKITEQQEQTVRELKKANKKILKLEAVGVCRLYQQRKKYKVHTDDETELEDTSYYEVDQDSIEEG